MEGRGGGVGHRLVRDVDGHVPAGEAPRTDERVPAVPCSAGGPAVVVDLHGRDVRVGRGSRPVDADLVDDRLAVTVGVHRKVHTQESVPAALGNGSGCRVGGRQGHRVGVVDSHLHRRRVAPAIGAILAVDV